MSRLNRVLVLFAHPALEKSRINCRLFQAIKSLDHVTCHDLYEAYPTFDINVEYEQDLLLKHDIVVFQHPLYWYSSPAILKEWQDLVLEYGFAYGHDGTALHGKKFLTAITAGGSRDAYCRQGYNVYSIRELLRPFEQTARLCGMTYLPPFVVYNTHQLNDSEDIQPHVNDYCAVIKALRDDTVRWDMLSNRERINADLSQVVRGLEAAHYA